MVEWNVVKDGSQFECLDSIDDGSEVKMEIRINRYQKECTVRAHERSAKHTKKGRSLDGMEKKESRRRRKREAPAEPTGII